MSSAPGRSDASFHRVTVVGLGVVGGSLARDLSSEGSVQVRGWSPVAAERREAEDAGAVTTAPGTLEAAVEGAEAVILATPLEAACRILPRVARLAGDAVLTDVASLKLPLERAAREAGLDARWVGGHPMAGSEGSGFAAGRKGLFRDARIWLVAHPDAEEPFHRVRRLWASVGGRPARTGAAEHDRLMALASHLPQLTANGLARVLEGAGVEPDALGPGGRDMTRLAASGPGMWLDLLAHAPPELPEGLRSLSKALEKIAEMVEDGEAEGLRALLNGTRRWKLPVEEEAP